MSAAGHIHSAGGKLEKPGEKVTRGVLSAVYKYDQRA
jgi:hypothetical protein